jgi:hypothetical protein
MLMRLLLTAHNAFFLASLVQKKNSSVNYVMFIKICLKIALYLSQDLFKVAFSFPAFFFLYAP